MKKRVLISFIVILSILCIQPTSAAFASDIPYSVTRQQVLSKIDFTVDEDGAVIVENVEDHCSVPIIYSSNLLNAVTSDAGTATIYWVNSGRIFWSIVPATNEYCTFVGKITIYSTISGNPMKILYISGAGNGELSGQETFSLPSKFTYNAVLSGGGTLGDKKWVVAPECQSFWGGSH